MGSSERVVLPRQQHRTQLTQLAIDDYVKKKKEAGLRQKMEIETDQKAVEGLWHKVVAKRDFKEGEEIGTESPFLGPVIQKQESDHFNFEKNWSWALTDLYFGQKAKFEAKFYGSKWSYVKWDDADSRELKQLMRKYSVSEAEVKLALDIITTNYLKLDLYRDYKKQIQLYSGGMFDIFSMLNHSCDPNAKLIDVMGEENHALKKGVTCKKTHPKGRRNYDYVHEYDANKRCDAER